eukprot:s971_g5.t1
MAWSIKRLVSSFKRSISRPHRPRSSIIRSIMEHAGIPVPASTAGSDDESDEICEGEEEMEEDPAIEEAALEIPSGSVGPAATEVKVKEEEMEKEILMVAPPSKKHKREAPTAASKIPKATNEAPSEAEKAPSETGIPSAGTPSETGKAPSETGKAPSARKAPSETGKALSDSGKAHSETGQALSATGGASNESGKAASKAPERPRPQRNAHVVLALNDGNYECQGCGLMGDLATITSVECDGRRQAKIKELEKLRELTLALQEMKRQRLYEQEAQQTKPSVKASKTPSNKCPCTDNLDTQVWMEDSQPPWDPTCKTLSFDDAADSPGSETAEPMVYVGFSNEVLRRSERLSSEPDVSLAASKPKIATEATKPKIATEATKPEIATEAAKPEIATEAAKPEIATEASGSKIEVASTGVRTRGSKVKCYDAPPLPAKPSCMAKIPPSICPKSQKRKKEEEEIEEPEEEAGDEEDVDGDALTEAPEDETNEADDDDDENDEEGAEQEEEEEEAPRKVFRRPASKAKSLPKAKAKAKAKSKAKGKPGRPPKASAKTSPKKPKQTKPTKTKATEAASKALKSRKSVAYHKARADALAAGMSAEEASEIGKEATQSHVN